MQEKEQFVYGPGLGPVGGGKFCHGGLTAQALPAHPSPPAARSPVCPAHLLCPTRPPLRTQLLDPVGGACPTVLKEDPQPRVCGVSAQCRCEPLNVVQPFAGRKRPTGAQGRWPD